MRQFPILLAVALTNLLSAQPNYSNLVNPFIGTGGHGHTYPGATTPFGMVQLSPDTRMDDWDGCGGYHYTDTVIYGFSHTHLSGTGVPDYCDLLMQPFVGKTEWEKEAYASRFRHESEQARAGFYQVRLEKHNIDVQLTTTTRTGLQKYTFAEGEKEGKVLIDLTHRDPVIDSYLELADHHTLRGYRFSKSWASNQRLYFVIQFSEPIAGLEWQAGSDSKTSPTSAQGRRVKTAAKFKLPKSRQLMVKVGLSGVSMEGAALNLKTEQKGFKFGQVLDQATKAWNKELSKIEVESYEAVQDTVFYTALYHTMIAPNIYQDVDGKYRGMDDQIHTAVGFTNYTVFSLWDTHRAYHPLMSIINQKRTSDWINTFLHQYKHGGVLPVWELAANETWCMIGYHSVPVITDAYQKGIRNFDTKLALEAMQKSANMPKFGIDLYAKQGFLGNDLEAESVSKTLEYAYDDWCIGQFAEATGHPDIARQFRKRALNYRNVFNPAEQFFQGKLESNWYEPFDPKEVNHFYTEGNAWHYAFTAQQDIGGMIELYGGLGSFTAKLKEMFLHKEKMTGRDQADVTGLIGQYAHGNEPSHHIAWLFNYTDEPAFGHRLIQNICTDFYPNAPDGLIGNEDCGQMSAWYVFSSLGFYPPNAAGTEMAVGPPQFKKAIIHLENGKDFIITSQRKDRRDFRIAELLINGQKQDQLRLTYEQIANGGSMAVSIQDGKESVLKQFDRLTVPPIDRSEFIPVPYVGNKTTRFDSTIQVVLKSIDPRANIRYQLNGKGKNDGKWMDYKGPIQIESSASIRFLAQRDGISSAEVSQEFYKIARDKSIQVMTKVAPMYTDGGFGSLIDGIVGNPNWRAGKWQSYYGNDLVAIIDLGASKVISKAGGIFLQETKSWIWMPQWVEVWTSEDGREFTSQGVVRPPIADTDEEGQMREIIVNFKPHTTRYIKVKAANIGPVPEWHVGRGLAAHLFVTELVVE